MVWPSKKLNIEILREGGKISPSDSTPSSEEVQPGDLTIFIGQFESAVTFQNYRIVFPGYILVISIALGTTILKWEVQVPVVMFFIVSGIKYLFISHFHFD